MTKITPLFRRPLPKAYFYATLGIVAVNLLVYVLTQMAPQEMGWMVLQPAEVARGAWWQVFTYMYIHGGFTHLLFNLIALLFFGLAVEEDLGSWEFLIFYHVTGALAGSMTLAIYAVTGQYAIPLLGASGAVYAVTLAFAAYRPHAIVLLLFIPMRARNLVILFVAFSVFSEIFDPYSGVSHLTHLAGFVFAFLYLLLRLRINAWTRFWE